MKPHLWKRGGKWHYSVPNLVGGTTIVWWPRGAGDTPRGAFVDYEKRAEERLGR